MQRSSCRDGRTTGPPSRPQGVSSRVRSRPSDLTPLHDFHELSHGESSCQSCSPVRSEPSRSGGGAVSEVHLGRGLSAGGNRGPDTSRHESVVFIGAYNRVPHTLAGSSLMRGRDCGTTRSTRCGGNASRAVQACPAQAITVARRLRRVVGGGSVAFDRQNEAAFRAAGA